jgi:hypothetical protein
VWSKTIAMALGIDHTPGVGRVARSGGVVG